MMFQGCRLTKFGVVLAGEVCVDLQLAAVIRLTKSSVGPALWLATFYQSKRFIIQKGHNGKSDGAEGEDGARVGDFLVENDASQILL